MDKGDAVARGGAGVVALGCAAGSARCWERVLAVTGRRFVGIGLSARVDPGVSRGAFVETFDVLRGSSATGRAGCTAAPAVVSTGAFLVVVLSDVNPCKAASTTKPAIVAPMSSRTRDPRAGSARVSQVFA
jgi:hypothetical protein